jgi:C-terminal processing protease CtpA/Prc
VAYVDLRRLELPDVDSVIDSLGSIEAIVFDLRGYPRGSGMALASRLNSRGARACALVRVRELSKDTVGQPDAGLLSSVLLPESRDPYRGRTVVLIDERTISQGETIALLLEAGADATFVGTPTAGANGEVTTLTLPGGLEVTFTGQEIRHADGRQLQGVGIAPDVTVAPTVDGIRAGRDEVLERALELLREEPLARDGTTGEHLSCIGKRCLY